MASEAMEVPKVTQNPPKLFSEQLARLTEADWFREPHKPQHVENLIIPKSLYDRPSSTLDDVIMFSRTLWRKATARAPKICGRSARR